MVMGTTPVAVEKNVPNTLKVERTADAKVVVTIYDQGGKPHDISAKFRSLGGSIFATAEINFSAQFGSDGTIIENKFAAQVAVVKVVVPLEVSKQLVTLVA